MTDRRRKLQQKSAERRAADELDQWLKDNHAVEGRTFDEETGRPMRTFTIDLTKEK